MLKKNLILCIALMLLLTGCSGVSLKKHEKETFATANEMLKNIEEIKIKFDPKGTYFNEAKQITIRDTKIIKDIILMVAESKPLTDETKVKDLSGMTYKSELIVTLKDGSSKTFKAIYDTLYEIGYVEMDGKKLEPDYSFFRYIHDLNEYQNPDTNIEKEVVKLFNKYNWTVDYKINTLKEKLPENLKHKAGESPVKIYWAYNLELSKQIGFDFTKYLGKDIVVEIYRLREPLPEFLEPRRDARGVILKYNEKVVGAYIDAGRHDSFACSLDRKSLIDITGKDWDRWIKEFIDYEDQLEKRLSKMKPQEIIEEYFEALDKNDIKRVWACMTRKNLSGHLATNMDNQYLFNKDLEIIDYNIKSAKLLKIKELKGFDNESEGGPSLKYQVEVDFDFVEPTTSEDGVGTRFVIMKKESEKSGWRIDSIGTGP